VSEVGPGNLGRKGDKRLGESRSFCRGVAWRATTTGRDSYVVGGRTRKVKDTTRRKRAKIEVSQDEFVRASLDGKVKEDASLATIKKEAEERRDPRGRRAMGRGGSSKYKSEGIVTKGKKDIRRRRREKGGFFKKKSIGAYIVRRERDKMRFESPIKGWGSEKR